jgi:hypothetical protein
MMGKEQHVGLYRKYVIERTDGSSEPGKKHEKCDHFVLDFNHDPFALPAILAYAQACRKTHPELANDLFKAAGTYPFTGGRTLDDGVTTP